MKATMDKAERSEMEIPSGALLGIRFKCSKGHEWESAVGGVWLQMPTCPECREEVERGYVNPAFAKPQPAVAWIGRWEYMPNTYAKNWRRLSLSNDESGSESRPMHLFGMDGKENMQLLNIDCDQHSGKTVAHFEDEYGNKLDTLYMLDSLVIVFTDKSRVVLLPDWRGQECYFSQYG